MEVVVDQGNDAKNEVEEVLLQPKRVIQHFTNTTITTNVEGGGLKQEKINNEEIEELNGERVLKILPTHGFYCPNCYSCIRKVYIQGGEREQAIPDQIRCTTCLCIGIPYLVPIPSGVPSIVQVGVVQKVAISIKALEIAKSIVYGGFTQLLASLAVVISAASADATIASIVKLALANLVGGLFMFIHNIQELKAENKTKAAVDRYKELLGERKNYSLHTFIGVISFIVFGLVPPLVYTFSFHDNDDNDLNKLGAVVIASLLCITLLSIVKAYTKNSNSFEEYSKTVIGDVSDGARSILFTYFKLSDDSGSLKQETPEVTIKNENDENMLEVGDSTILAAHDCPRPSDFPRLSDCPPRLSDCPPRLSDCPPRLSDCPPRPSNCPPRPSDCPPRPSDCPPRPSDFPRPSNDCPCPSDFPRLSDYPRPSNFPRPSDFPRPSGGGPKQETHEVTIKDENHENILDVGDSIILPASDYPDLEVPSENFRCLSCFSFFVSSEPEITWENNFGEEYIEVESNKAMEVVKSIVYGGLIESLASLTVVTTAASADSTILSILALTLANLISGLFIFVHKYYLQLGELKVEEHEREASMDQYNKLLRRRKNLYLHAFITIISFIVFGLVPPLVYGFSFHENGDNDFKKLGAVAVVSLLCITLLSIAKAYTKNLFNVWAYLKTVIYYVISGVVCLVLSYLAGDLVKILIEKVSLLEPSSNLGLHVQGMSVQKTEWSSY